MERKRTVTVGHLRAAHREADMNSWWWVLIGLAAWFGVSLAVGLMWLGPALGRSARARDALDAQAGETPGREKSPHDGPRAA
jgi:hypothetical protein